MIGIHDAINLDNDGKKFREFAAYNRLRVTNNFTKRKILTNTHIVCSIHILIIFINTVIS